MPADTSDFDRDGNVTEPVPLDVERRARFIDAQEPDSGTGPAPIADLGGFERQ